MAVIVLENEEVVVRLQRREKIAGLLRDLRFPLTSVSRVEVIADALDALCGFRAPGLAIPGRKRIGTWRSRRGKLFAVVRHNEPAVRLELRNEAFRSVVVCVEDAPGIAEKLRLAAGLPPAPHFSNDEVRFHSAGLDLSGSWMRPDGPTVGAALILPGSGEIDRNADHRRMPLGISRDIAQSLAARGIASLRYDKRGTGSSGGTFLTAGFAQNTEDAAAALRYTAQRAGGLPVFLVGHSEGACHAAVLAAEPPVPLAGAVMLSAPARSGFETARWQLARISGTLPAFPRALLKLLRIDLIKLHAKSVAKIQGTTSDVVRVQGRRINALWQREFLAFDPVPYLKRIQVPVLAATGTKDLQVDPADLDVITESVLGPVTSHRLEDVTHLLRHTPGSPSLRDYKRQIREPVNADVLDLVSSWIQESTVMTDQCCQFPSDRPRQFCGGR